MTTHFVARGLLERVGDQLRLTAAAREHLVASSPWFLGPYFPKLSDRPIALDLIEVLRTDRPANYASRKHEVDWHKAMETEAFAEEFTAAMDCRGRLCAQALARYIDLGSRRRLLDIAGGSGIYACSLAARFPELTASVLEKPPVDRIAQRAIDQRGYGARVNVVAGDMLAEPLPEGYDVHLWSNVLHDWDVPIVKQLLQASAAALKAGAGIVIHDAFLNADKTGPLAHRRLLGPIDARDAGTLLFSSRDGDVAAGGRDSPRRTRFQVPSVGAPSSPTEDSPARPIRVVRVYPWLLRATRGRRRERIRHEGTVATKTHEGCRGVSTSRPVASPAEPAGGASRGATGPSCVSAVTVPSCRTP